MRRCPVFPNEADREALPLRLRPKFPTTADNRRTREGESCSESSTSDFSASVMSSLSGAESTVDWWAAFQVGIFDMKWLIERRSRA